MRSTERRGSVRSTDGRTLDGPTLVVRLTLNGIVAPMVPDRAINTGSFEASVERFLAPTLRPADIVVMDNLCSHESARTR